ncbi:unnamed protein product, partial [Effrenium voratum]
MQASHARTCCWPAVRCPAALRGDVAVERPRRTHASRRRWGHLPWLVPAFAWQLKRRRSACWLAASAHSAQLDRTQVPSGPGCRLWGCRCTTAWRPQDLPAAKQLTAWWRRRSGQQLDIYQEEHPDGYRTRAKLAVGPSREGPVIGLFQRGTFDVARCCGCRANHPALDAALKVLEDVLRAHPQVEAFHHAESSAESAALRNVELTVERPTGLVQLVLLWNGRRGDDAPELGTLVDSLWPAGSQSDRWHSILVHWRDPDPSLLREMRSKRRDAWEQRRPATRRGVVRATVSEHLDGLPFSFGAKSFRQANLFVYEQILRDMKAQLLAVAGKGAQILELCGGVGVLGLSLAKSLDATLLSTDVNPESGELFKVNAARLLPAESYAFAALSAERALCAQQVAGLNGRAAEVLILDPPRRGLGCQTWRSGRPAGQQEAEAIRSSTVRVVIYMSCGPRSFMQDAERLTSPGATPAFRLTWLRLYDMFPFTEHIETLGIFVRDEVCSASATGTEMTWKPWEEMSFLQEAPAERLERGRYQCQFLVGIEDPEFQVVGRILGRGGANMKRIAGKTNAKMRLRGRGSGFKEADLDGQESTDPLMLCVSAPDADSYREAAEEVRSLLLQVYKAASRDVAPLQVHEGPRDLDEKVFGPAMQRSP